MFVSVAIEDIKGFLRYVKPQYRFTVEVMDDELDIEFTEQEDYEKALKWVYSVYCEDCYTEKGLAYTIHYNEKMSSYGWVCHFDNAVKYGFDNPEAVRDSADEYINKF